MAYERLAGPAGFPCPKPALNSHPPLKAEATLSVGVEKNMFIINDLSDKIEPTGIPSGTLVTI
jgi:hypothetical protein